MYQVKFTDSQDNKRFGIVNKYHEQAEEFAAIGQSVVEDILTGEVGVIDTARLTEVPMGVDSWGKMDRNGVSWGGSDLNDYLSLEQLAHEIRDLFNTGEGVHKNTLFYCGVGDGSAAYVVTDVTTRSYCQVEWRGFCPDRYVAQPWGYGGRFLKATVSRMAGGRGLFGNQATPDEKLASFREKYADYLERFSVVPVGMEDLIN
jgi:hypothetical protein